MTKLSDLLSQRHNSFNHAEAMEFIDKIEVIVKDLDKGCSACDLEDEDNCSIGIGLNPYGEECYYLMVDGEAQIEINCCPMCGRNLNLRKEVETNG